MHPVPARRRRRLLLALALTTASAAVPATAQAAHVTSLGDWKTSNTYLVETDLDGRAQPAKDPVAKVDHVKAGDWIPIECQVTGASAYGSTVWIRTGGLYVPDHYVKTYTDGFLPGVPKCDVSGPAAPPKPPSQDNSGPTQGELAAAIKTVTYEVVGGSNYRITKAKYPQTAYPSGKGIIWKNDGCSIPEKVQEISIVLPGGHRPKPGKFYGDLFQKSCDRHDFGYRNYGTKAGGRALDPTKARRETIDARLGKNLGVQCDKRFRGGGLAAVNRTGCHKAAGIIVGAVRRFGASSFFAG